MEIKIKLSQCVELISKTQTFPVAIIVQLFAILDFFLVHLNLKRVLQRAKIIPAAYHQKHLQ